MKFHNDQWRLNKKSWTFMKFNENVWILRKPLKIYDNAIYFMAHLLNIYKNDWQSWTHMKICNFYENPWTSIKINGNAWKNKNILKINKHIWKSMQLMKNKWKSVNTNQWNTNDKNVWTYLNS